MDSRRNLLRDQRVIFRAAQERGDPDIGLNELVESRPVRNAARFLQQHELPRHGAPIVQRALSGIDRALEVDMQLRFGYGGPSLFGNEPLFHDLMRLPAESCPVIRAACK